MKTKLKKLSKRTVSVLLTLVILLLMAVIGIVNVSAWGFAGNNKVYYVNTGGWSQVGIMVNNANWTAMSQISNTGVYYKKIDNAWTNDNGGIKFSGDYKDSNTFNDYLGSGVTKCYSETTGWDSTVNLNGTATVVSLIDNGSGEYSEASDEGCVATISSINITGDGTNTQASSNSTGSSASAVCYPAYGATVTYSANDSALYQFMGFATASNSSLPAAGDLHATGWTQISTGHNGGGNLGDVYAYFKIKETKYSVTVSSGANGKVSVNGAAASASDQTVNVGTITKASVEAVPDRGYTFNNWTVSSANVTGVTDGSTTNPISEMGATGTGTVTANFSALPAQTVNVASPDYGTLAVTLNKSDGETEAYSEGDTFTAYPGETLTVTATPDSHYETTSLTAGGQIMYSGGTYTIVGGTNPTVDATFEYATTYRIKVFAGAGGTTQFQVGSGEFTTITENTAKNFNVDWDSGYTVKWVANSGHTFTQATKNGSQISTKDNDTATGTNADNGAVYKTEFSESWPPVSGYANVSTDTSYIYVANNDKLDSDLYTYSSASTSNDYKILKNGSKYWITLSADNLAAVKRSDENFYVAFASSSGHSAIAGDAEASIDSTYNYGIDGSGTQSYNFSDANGKKYVYFNTDSVNYSTIDKIGILVDFSNTSKPSYKIYSSSGSAVSYDYDPFYIGGRFKIKDGDTTVYTGDEIWEWSNWSDKMKFTDNGNNLYSIDTGLTLGDYTKIENNDHGVISYSDHLFMIHDMVDRYGVADADYSGNSFHLNRGRANAIELNPIAGTLLPDHELLFDDPDNTSNGIIKIWIDAKDYAEGNSASTLRVWYTLEEETPGVADSLSFSVAPSQATIGDTVTLTATASGLNGLIDGPTEVKFVFEEKVGDAWTELATVTGSAITALSNPDRYRASTTVTKNAQGSHDFRVRVATTASYDGGTALREIGKYGSATWNPQTVYYTSDITSSTANPTWTAINAQTHQASIATTVSSGNSYTIALSNKAEYNTQFKDFTVDTNSNRFCDIAIVSKTVSIDNVDRAINTYVVTPRTGCSNPTIYLNSETRKIYAVANYDKYTDKEKTLSNTTEKVKYYFAKPADKDFVGSNNLDGTNGLNINYWNNSVDSKNGTKWAVPVKADGTTSTGSYISDTKVYAGTDAYKIMLDETQLYRNTAGTAKSDNSTLVEYNVYVIELPIWATSANICNSSGTGQLGTPILSLNPNRIYVFWTLGDSDKQWSGVPLDKSFWKSEQTSGAHKRGQTGYEKNQVPLQNFKTNLVNYKTNGNLSTSMNTALSSVYNTRSIPRTLYWGMFADNQTQTYTGWDIALNLAQRNNEHSYYASVWNAVNSELAEDTTGVNPLGGGLLTAYNSGDKSTTVMPFFDYSYLSGTQDVGTAYTNVDFPFYRSEYDGVATYSYDSMVDLNRKYTISTGKYSTTNPVMVGSNLGYKPFVDQDATVGEAKAGFANEFDVDFYMTTTGTIKGDNETHDISFNFSGDDDVWVFVDGVLVLDLGGDHKISAGSINFSDMKVYYKTAAKDYSSGMGTGGDWATSSDNVYTMSLQTIMDAYGKSFNPKDATKRHKLQMFYMERGRNESNLSLSFNLPQASGLNIANWVKADNVNTGLKDAALAASNGDYFTYQLANMEATDAAITTLKGTTGYGNALLPSSTGQWAANTSSPTYPSFFDVVRTFGGQSFNLAKKNWSSPPAATGGSVPDINGENFTTLANTVYKLNDSYSDSQDEKAEVSGITANEAVPAQGIEAGDFHLLGDQVANFTDKVKPNSYVRIAQRQNLGDHQTDSEGLVQYKYVANNETGNYYLTSYDIYDEAAKRNIVDKTSFDIDYDESHSYYATDASAATNGFYFTNYSGDAQNPNPAMTVNFYNQIAVGEIRVAKELSAASSVLEEFCFKVEFCNVFGDDDDTTWKEYDVSYQIFDIENDAPVDGITYPYGEVGLVIKPGQYAKILGVPVETRFRVTEIPHASYSLANIDKTATKPDGSAINYTAHNLTEGFYNFRNQQATASTPSSASFINGYDNLSTSEYITTVGSDTFYTNMVPIICETQVASTNDYESISTVTFTNKKENFTIVFKYFDRYMISGQPAGINSSASTYSKSIDSITNEYPEYVEYVDDDPKKGVKTINFAGIIAKNAVDFSAATGATSIENLMCKYDMWTSQNDAETAMANKSYFVNGTPTSYTAEEAKYHTKYDGKPNSSGEKWVTYYDYNSQEVDEPSGEATNYLKVRRIVVWCYNSPRQYDVDIYGANSYDDLVQKTVGSNTYYVANAESADNTVKKSIDDFYYNQRLGFPTGTGHQDDAGFISNYGIEGVYKTSAGERVLPENYASESFTKDEGGTTYTYTFEYWAFDQAGTQIASYDRSFMYRIATKTKLYAVYSRSENGTVIGSEPGISISSNGSDTYVEDKTGVSRTRLNIMATVYNTVPFDPLVQKLAFVNVSLSTQIRNNSNVYTPKKITELMEQYKEQLIDIIKAHEADKDENAVFGKGVSNTFTGDIDPVTGVYNPSINLTLTTKGYIYTVTSNGNDLGEGEKSILLTNKNRAQYTISYKTSALIQPSRPTCLVYVGAMKYNGTWSISPNCLIYKNGEVVSNDAASWE